MIRITMLNSNMLMVDVPKGTFVKKVCSSGREKYGFVAGQAKLRRRPYKDLNKHFRKRKRKGAK